MTRGELKHLHALLSDVIKGLDGTPFRWGDGRTNFGVTTELGLITLVTKTAMKERGHVLKQRAKPVGQAYFGGKIDRWIDLYVLDVQTKPATKSATPREQMKLPMKGAPSR